MTVHFIPYKPDNIIGLDIDGRIDAEDIDRIVKAVDKKLKTEDKLRIYAEVNSWSGMSLRAFINDLKFSLQHLQNFEKEAIVSDRKWLETLAALGNTLFPSIEVKYFTFDERDKALEWVFN
ncbi:STAS/SEC14 domain-containing protein [Pleurocapsales cyanobacterium LEGE 10410]|nr:STAS/SEC14 domain-containing protein [Pleurocapsales cyanobacterium LEGE 10410]